MASFWLEFEQDGQVRQYSFDSASVSVGRDKAADFVLDHPTVSRQHALIVSNHNGVQLVVLSRGGLTAIDGQQVSGEVSLYDGNQLHFGQLSFTFRSNDLPRAQPANGGFGSQSPAASGSFGSFQPSQSGNFNQFGNAAASGSFGGFNQPGQTGNFGQMNAASSGSFGGFNQPGQTGNFGKMNAASSGSFGGFQGQAPQKQEDDWNPGGTWGKKEEDPDIWDRKKRSDDNSNGIQSWDDIAAGADADGSAQRGATDFERMQAAQEKARKQSEGNPLLKIGGLVGIVLMMGYLFWPAPENGPDIDETPVNERAFIEWPKNDPDLDCVGKPNCQNAAIAAFKVGKETYDRKNADITNLYTSYRQYDRAEKLLEKGQITALPGEMKDVKTRKAAVKKEIDGVFQSHRVKFHNFQVRKMYTDMAEVLQAVVAYFPDKRCAYYQWAVGKEREMKDNGTWPSGFALGS